jgi:hypothetical protein
LAIKAMDRIDKELLEVTVSSNKIDSLSITLWVRVKTRSQTLWVKLISLLVFKVSIVFLFFKMIK